MYFCIGFVILVICLVVNGSNIKETESITVSGISSGGAFAVQFHVAHSSMVSGAGIVAGVPYYCAGGNVALALTCMEIPESIILPSLYTATAYAYSVFTIDSPLNLASSKVYLYSGSKDTVVLQGTVKKLQSYYENYIPSSSIKTVYDIPSQHSFVTNSFGNDCDVLGEPYLNNCSYDQAGAIFNQLYGNLKQPTTPNSKFVKIKQAKFLPLLISLKFASLEEYAYLYVPSKCGKGNCRLHVAFHGCEQTLDMIGTTFVEHAGYNSWAESNNIIVLYPQATRNLFNPKACWDWWGFTGTAYASKLGVQIATVKSMADYVLDNY